MTPNPWNDDQMLLDDLAQALRAVAPTARAVAERAEGALSWLTVDEELMIACLSFDSREDQLSAVRSEPGDTRTLVFTAAPLSIELEINPRGVLGQVVPPGEGEIFVEAADGSTVSAAADDLGFFVLPAVPEGPVRLRCETATGRLVTHWVRL